MSNVEADSISDPVLPELDVPFIEEIDEKEKRVREWVDRGFRFVFAVIASYQLFDFLFSPLWMHGYLWSLNLPLDVDLKDKPAGFIMDRQLAACGVGERILYASLSTLAVCVVLYFAGYGKKQHSVWHLFHLSVTLGLSLGLLRCQQMHHRLYSTIHDVFFIYLNFFFVGLIMTLRPGTSFEPPYVPPKKEKSKKAKKKD